MNGPEDDATGRAGALPDLTEFAALARIYEPERYLAATLAPQAQRPSLIALAAFAADLQRIAATATQPTLGEIRLQWWRDGLETVAKGGLTGSPLADALGQMIVAHDLPVAMLQAVTEARAWDLYDDPMPDQAALDGYFAKTEAIPFELALRLLGLKPGDAAPLARAAGHIFGMTRLLARLPVHLAAGRLPLPAVTLSAHQLDPETLLAGTTTPAVRAMVAALAADVRTRNAALRPQLRTLTRSQCTGVLALATVSPYLRLIESRQRDPLQEPVELQPLRRAWVLAWAHFSGVGP